MMDQNEYKKVLRDYNQQRRPHNRGSVCLAPSVSLNFEQSGAATACCYNRRFILGRYPKQSVQEIWQSERTQELRSLLKNGDLSQGCELCRHQLEARNFAGVHTKMYDEVQDRYPGGDPLLPRLMEFELSNICNFECVMCNGYFSSAIRRNREKLEPQIEVYDDAFVEQLRPFIPNLVQAKFLGGEPFLNPLYYKIWDLFEELNPAVNVTVTTNASIMNKKVISFLEKLRPTITVSCDSLDKKTYEAIRRNSDFGIFSQNLEIFRKAARPDRLICLVVCPMTNNWKTLPGILKYCDQNRATIGFNTVVWPPDFSIKNLPKKEIQKIHRFLSEGQSVPQAIEPWWQRFNRAQYQGLLNQIGMWAKDAPELV